MNNSIFLIHPFDLQRRRARCKPIVENLLKLERESVYSCNVCGSRQNVIISNKDRYGFPIRSAMCLSCGLIYLLDRFTVRGYNEFYTKGSYRALISQFKGKRQTLKRIQAEQANYTARLIPAMRGYINTHKGARLLDVGGSTGLIALEFVKHYDFNATVLDPAQEEVWAAQKLGLDGVVGTIESWDTQERFELILLCKTIDHLLDLKGALLKIYNLLREDGLFYCDITDFLEICRREGPPEATTKIDHCYCLCQETAVRLFRSLGFEVVFVNLTLPPEQVGFLLRKDRPLPTELVSKDWLEKQLRLFREIKSDWQRYGETPIGLLDWAKQKAYRLKKIPRFLSSE